MGFSAHHRGVYRPEPGDANLSPNQIGLSGLCNWDDSYHFDRGERSRKRTIGSSKYSGLSTTLCWSGTCTTAIGKEGLKLCVEPCGFPRRSRPLR